MSRRFRDRLALGLGLVAVAAAWLLAGLFEREPWKADEAYTVGMIHSIVEHRSWLVPMLGGEPFLEKPPFVFWVGALAAEALHGMLPMHVAARFANVLLTLGTFALVWRAAGLAMDRRRAWMAVWLLAAAPSFLISTRFLTADLGLLLGAGFVCLGLVQLVAGIRTAGALVGLGTSIGLLSKGLVLPGVTAVAWSALVLLSPTWRTAFAWRQAGIALLAFAVAGLPWPLMLWLDSPEHFHTWFVVNNLERFFGGNNLGPANDRLRTALALAGYLLPGWAMAVAAAVRWRRSLSLDAPLAGPAMFALAWIAMLLVSTSARVIYALPALVPLAMCAAGWFAPTSAPASPPTARARAWRSRGVLLLLIAPAALAIGYRLTGKPPSPASAVLPGHLALALACIALGALAWRLGWRPRWPQALAGGLALGLAMALTLFLDSADQRAGFSAVLRSVARQVPADQCLASRAFGESERGMLDYFADRRTVRVEVAPDAARRCGWLLNQRRLREESLPDCPAGWSERRFRRPGDDQEYQLCVRPATAG